MIAGDAFLGRPLDAARQLFADHRAHRRGDEIEIHDRDRDALPVDLAEAA